ncbi:FkbM family methyltransferase [Roseovarius sp. 10]|uniref:FkbM family methyltransferase n=1 Tax=Roseovarius sp. 10 TaxID=3080563 RepID=UPI0029555767|nr:FkbM family methyltransferase [Roseovarius sp. 10]MDV7199723.1 FkbM family methyltransferase [Roseovarius sp. 10]
MNATVRKKIKKLAGQKIARHIEGIRANFHNRRGKLSYSQDGEDIILSSLLLKIHGENFIRNGFYVDIGAHHPYRFSNTCLFYKRGWSGINVDAMPGSMYAFRKYRSRDVNLEIGVGHRAEGLKFYVFNEPALNTFDESLAKSRCNEVWRIIATVDVPVLPLSAILRQHVPYGQKIDFLSVDVEGLDLEVLKSNDWEEHRPLVVAVEILGLSLENLASNPLFQYMKSVGYVVYAKTINTTFFVDFSFSQKLLE